MASGTCLQEYDPILFPLLCAPQATVHYARKYPPQLTRTFHCKPYTKARAVHNHYGSARWRLYNVLAGRMLQYQKEAIREKEYYSMELIYKLFSYSVGQLAIISELLKFKTYKLNN